MTEELVLDDTYVSFILDDNNTILTEIEASIIKNYSENK
jgi:hypothetical protein